MDRKKIEAQRSRLITAVRDYARSQTAQWRKVPHLALEADGRTGYSDTYGRAYQQGVWAVESSVEDGMYAVYIDLATGELISAHAFHRTESVCTPANGKDILRLASNLDHLDAKAIIASLIAQAAEKYPSYYDAATQDARREKDRREYKVKTIYDAKHRVPAPESFEDLTGSY
jgi:hypothetical protein